MVTNDKIVVKKTADNFYFIELLKDYYEREAVFRAANEFTDKFTFYIEPTDELHVGVFFKPNNEHTDKLLDDFIRLFCNRALDYQVRLDLEKQYRTIRNLIVKHAFSPLSLDELHSKSSSENE